MSKKRDNLLLLELDPYYPPIEVSFKPIIRVKVREIDLIENKVEIPIVFRGYNFAEVLERVIRYGRSIKATRLIVDVPKHLKDNAYYKDFEANIRNYFPMEEIEDSED